MQMYAVVYFPKEEFEQVQTFREKYDPQCKVIPPHITLVFPFSDIPEKDIVAHLSVVAKNFQKFPIHLNGLMRSADNYLFLLVQGGNEEIVRLHKSLYSGILAEKFHNDFPFVPHITLGDFNNNNLYEKAYKEAENLHLDLRTDFGQITLIKGDGISPATVIQSFDLQQ